MANMAYISRFLSKVEGPRQLTGYIPCNRKGGGTANYKGGPNPELYQAMGASGVTIATGCDLGQTDYRTMVGYGLSCQTAELYGFYYGKRKEAAIEALHARPLVITEATGIATDMAVHTGYLNRYVRPAYERASSLKFDELPDQCQAVIMSVCFQKGCGGVAKDWPLLWRHLVNGNFSLAARELLTGFSQYTGRRKMEGRLLLELEQ